MDLGDPLADYRTGHAASMQELERFLEEQGILDAELFDRGGPPVAVAPGTLYLVDEGDIFRIDREQVTGVGEIRAADHSKMRWGAALYVLALPLMFLEILGPGLILAVLMAIAGGVLVTLGYLSKALLIQVDDERIPPFVIDHRQWKRIRSRIQDWG